MREYQPDTGGRVFWGRRSFGRAAAHNRKGFEAAPASVWDPAARIKDQERDGLEAEVIYTSMGMPLYGLDNTELRDACFRAYNDWSVDYCSHDPKRLLPLGLITLEDIEAGTRELERIAKKGMRGAMIWLSRRMSARYSHTDYDPFWAAASDPQYAAFLTYPDRPEGHGY